LWTHLLQKIVIELTCRVSNKTRVTLLVVLRVYFQVFDGGLLHLNEKPSMIWVIFGASLVCRFPFDTMDRQVRFSNRWTCSSDHRLLEGGGNLSRQKCEACGCRLKYGELYDIYIYLNIFIYIWRDICICCSYWIVLMCIFSPFTWLTLIINGDDVPERQSWSHDVLR